MPGGCNLNFDLTSRVESVVGVLCMSAVIYKGEMCLHISSLTTVPVGTSVVSP